MFFRLLTLCFLISINVLNSAQVFSYDTSNKNQWLIRTSSKVDTSIPKRFKPMKSNNLNDRLAILPEYLQQYKTQDQFMVIPDMGLIVPIVELAPDNPDAISAKKWWDFDYNKYLVDGPTIYPGTASVGNPWNTFIFAHSNYWHDKPGNFKNIFRLTYNIEKWDSILYYKKINWVWKLYTYKVTDSMLVKDTDVRVMMPKKDKKELTLSACRPIGTSQKRRINKAELSWEETLTYEVNPNSTSSGTVQDSSWSTINSSSQTWAYSYQPGFNEAAQLALDSAWHVILAKP